MLELILISLLPFSIISSSSLSLSLSIDLFLFSQEEQRQRAKRNREELRVMMEEHEEVHSGIRWRRVCAIFEDHPLWKAVNPEERKDVFEDVTFALAKKERVRIDGGRGGSMQVLVEKDFWTLTHTCSHLQEQERKQRERNCSNLAKILESMTSVTYRTTWAQVSKFHLQDKSGLLTS